MAATPSGSRPIEAARTPSRRSRTSAQARCPVASFRCICPSSGGNPRSRSCASDSPKASAGPRRASTSVSGEAGIGKSRVTEELAAGTDGRSSDHRGGPLLGGRLGAGLLPVGRSPPSDPGSATARHGSYDKLGGSVEELGQLLPELAVVQLRPGRGSTPMPLGFRLFEAVTAVWRAAADVAPLVVRDRRHPCCRRRVAPAAPACRPPAAPVSPALRDDLRDGEARSDQRLRRDARPVAAGARDPSHDR